MFFNIALKNVKKSFKDYTIYFLTLTLAVSIFYSFNSFNSQELILNMNNLSPNYLESLNKVLSIVSVFVAFILSGLILYANNFLIKKRNKELGIYMTLGMGKSKVSKMLIYETMIVGILSLISGLILGLVVSQALFIVLTKILDLSIVKFNFVISLDAIFKTIIYFSIMFLGVIIFNTLVISKYKIIDLLTAGRKNEQIKTKNPLVYFSTFILSIVLLIIAYTLIFEVGLLVSDQKFIISIILGIIGTMLFFYGATSTVIYFAKKSNKFYFKNLNMFLVKQIDSKVKTNFLSMSVISLMLFLTITLLSTGFGLKNALNAGLKDSTPFDGSMYMYVNNDDKIDHIKEVFEKENIDLKEENIVFYNEYVKNIKIADIMSLEDKSIDYEIAFLKVSDYNKLQQLKNKEPVDLESEEILITSNVAKIVPEINKYIKENNTVKINNQTYNIKNKNVIEENFKTTTLKSNFITIIINDKFLENASIHTSVLNINFSDENSEKEFESILESFNSGDISNDDAGFITGSTRRMIFIEDKELTSTLLFIVIYLGLVFLISSMAVLALQQLSEASESITRYRSLKKLGVNDKSLKKSIFTQILIYFTLPVGVALVHSIVGIKVISNFISLFNTPNILGSSLITVGFLMLIYIIYFYTTYKSYKDIVMNKI